MELSKQQKAIVQEASKRLDATIIGEAGTGKTEVLKYLYEVILKNNQSVVVIAPTHKAVFNLLEQGVITQTAHSFIRASRNNYTNFVLIDEVFALDEDILNTIKNNMPLTKFIHFGDKMQLKPVNGKAYNPQAKTIYELTENFRQINTNSDMSIIIKRARNKVSGVNEDKIPLSNDNSFSQVSSRDELLEAFKASPSDSKHIIAYSNNRVDWYNKQMMNNKAYGSYIAQESGDGIYNGLVYELVNVKDGLAIIKNKLAQTLIKIDVKDLLDTSLFKPSFAMTIHKSQGTTVDEIFADMTNASRDDEDRLLYVALSRAKTKIVYFKEVL